MSEAPGVIAVFGPTGSGKTDVAVRVARKLGTEVVNADPAQCYRGLPILTNQPQPEHDAIAPHRLIGCWTLQTEASIVDFAVVAHQAIDELVQQKGSAVVCGGSGLYLQAAVSELATTDIPDRGKALRGQLDARYDALGATAAHAALAALDSGAAAKIHPNDRKRVVRAWQVALDGGSVAPSTSSMWDAPHRHVTRVAGLVVDRTVMRQRIGARTEQMFEAGVLGEVAGIVGDHAEHCDTALSVTARRLHGIDDCIGVLRAEHSRERAIEMMTTRTRQYAKRQDTWARRIEGLLPIATASNDIDQLADDIVSKVRA